MTAPDVRKNASGHRSPPPARRVTDPVIVAAHARAEKLNRGPGRVGDMDLIRQTAAQLGVDFARARDAVFGPLGVR